MARTSRPEEILIKKLRAEVEHIVSEAAGLKLSASTLKKFNHEILSVANDLSGLWRSLDPVEDPASVFDPGNPTTIGFFVGLAMAAQPRLPLTELRPFYGAGIYALYYTGNFEPYRPISGTETPSTWVCRAGSEKP